MDKKQKKHLLPAVRKAVQAVWGILQNGHLSGFVSGLTCAGPLKRFCVPGLNCYSCPGAVGACPLGSLQAALSAKKLKFPFYVLGFLLAAGVLLGRFVCGWLCLFGLIQELLFKIPTKKLRIPPGLDGPLRFLKYAVLLILAVLLPLALRDESGMSAPYFCKLLCPAGTLEGGIPLLILNKALRPAARFLWAWKFAVLLAVLAASVFIERPFCKYLCPLGAFYALFSKIGFLKIETDRGACVKCGKCAALCPMQVDPAVSANRAECIRCGACVSACPTDALRFVFIKGGSGKNARTARIPEDALADPACRPAETPSRTRSGSERSPS